MSFAWGLVVMLYNDTNLTRECKRLTAHACMDILAVTCALPLSSQRRQSGAWCLGGRGRELWLHSVPCEAAKLTCMAIAFPWRV